MNGRGVGAIRIYQKNLTIFVSAFLKQLKAMKKFILFFVFIVLAFVAKGQTNVSGFISANTTWTVAGAPYIIRGNTLLSHGFTLTIDPGVVVKFDSSKTLQIDGELIAIGAAQNRIIFTSNKATPAAGDWGEIHFSSTAVNATFDGNG